MTHLRVHRDVAGVTFQAEGRMTMDDSMPLRRLAENALAAGAIGLFVDLRHCTYMDSTFIGTLLLLRRKAGDRAKFAVVSPSSWCQKTLEVMGLDQMLDIVQRDEPPAEAWEAAAARPEDRGGLKFNVRDSHQAIAATASPVAESCRAVADRIAKELDAETTK